MKPYTIPLFFTELIIFLTLFYILIKVRKTKVSIAFVLFLTDVFLWMNVTFLLHNIFVSPFTFFLLRISSVFTFSLGFFTLNFIYTFLDRKPDFIYRTSLYLSILSIVIYNFTPLIVDFSPDNLRDSNYTNSLNYLARPYGSIILKGILIAVVIFPVIYSLYMLYKDSKRNIDTEKRGQLKIFLVGGITGTLIAALLTFFMSKNLKPEVFIFFQILTALSIVLSMILGMKKFGFLTPSIETFSEELFNNAKDGIIVLTPKYRVVNMNKAAKKWLNLDEDILEGLHIENIIKGIDWKKENFETKIGDKTFYIKKIPVVTNKLIGIIIMMIDITEEMRLREELLILNAELQERVTERTTMLQKTVEELEREMDARLRAEKELRETMNLYKTLFESGGDAIFLHDEKGYIVDINKKASHLLQLTKNDIVGLNIFDILNFDITKEELFRKIDEKEDFLVEGKITTHRNIEIYLEANIRGVIISGRKYYIVFARDITERKEAEKRLLDFSRLESISLFAGGIAHDFNNMLTSIFGNLSILKLKLYEKKGLYERIEKIESVLNDARALTSQLLSLSKGGEPIKELTTINELLVDTVNFALRGMPIELIMDIPQDLPPINIDKSQISRVIQNIVANAIEAMREGGTLTVKAEVLDVSEDKKRYIQKDRALRISIRDTGPGIPEDLLPHIFEPYFTTKKGGNGLGLVVAYTIVKKHEGDIEVESKVGEGTTFYIWLPISNEGRKIENKKDISNKERKEKIEKYKGNGKILVMDDEEMIRDFLKDALEMHGYEIDTAIDGMQAIDKYKKAMKQKRSFDLVIMDLTIPGGMGGKETIKVLKEIDPNVSAIVSSGYTDTDVLVRYREYGFSGYLRKPYTLSELFTLIGELLQSKNKQ